MRKLFVKAGRGYEILIEKGILASCGEYIRNVSNAEKVCVVSDSKVSPLYRSDVDISLERAGFKVYDFTFEAGEESKTPGMLLSLVDTLAKNEFTRSDLVVALGGGVCGDLAGFAAATYLRGIDYVQLPTSLLAQVDSSVGGKTAVDLPQGKNLFGAFHQPRLVLIDSETLNTLEPRVFADGMAEAIKMACIKSESLFNKIAYQNAKDIIDDIIFECVSLKAQIVERDEKEKGERALLNFGHTCGHAIEKLHNYTGITHGEAVGIGMILITLASERNRLTNGATASNIASLLGKYGLPSSDSNSLEDIIKAMSSDKKRSGDSINLVLIKDIGEGFIHPVKYDELSEFFGV